MLLNLKRVAVTLTYISVFALLFSCNDGNKAKPDTSAPKEEIAGNADRKLMVEELEKLKAVLASDNKEEIANVFDFPLSDSIQIYTESEAYQKELKQNGGKVTKALFLKYFQEIADDIQVAQINELFKNINTDGLLKQDKLDYENIIAAEPCYNFYSIEIKNNRITLSVGSGSNKDFKSEATGDEVPENSSEFCETVLWWVFSFDNGKLQLIKINGAG
jgi:hypothetical protein